MSRENRSDNQPAGWVAPEQRPMLQSHRIRITVQKRLFHQDMVDNYATKPESWAPCRHFREGDVYVTDRDEPWRMPQGFCSWAWADMQKLVYGMARGGQEMFVTCCTDGYRPVVFSLERE